MPHFRRLILALALLPLLGTHGCGEHTGSAETAKKEAQPSAARKVTTETAETRTLERTAELTGEVVTTNVVTVAALVDGPLACCAWREGDRVAAGQTLFEVDRPVYREEARTAEAALAVARARLADLVAGARPEEIAQAEAKVRQLGDCAAYSAADLARTESLVESGSLKGEDADKARVAASRCDTDLAAARERLGMLEAGPTVTALALQEATVAEAEARAGLARARLAEGVVTTPFAGVITQVYARPGDLATAKGQLLELADPASLVVRVGVPERDSAWLRPGTAARVRFDARPGDPLSLKVDRVYPELDSKTRTRAAELQVPDGLGVAAGMFARVTLVLERATGVVVPEPALVPGAGGGEAVFVVQDGAAHRRTVTVGLRDRGQVQVLSGVAAGEPVIVQGNEKLKDGSAVRVEDAGATSTAAGAGAVR